MKIGTLVKLEKHNEWLGVVIKTWTDLTGHSMCSVLWNKDMGVGLYFHDELEVLCK